MSLQTTRVKAAKKYFKNVSRTVLQSTNLKSVLFKKINRHEAAMPAKKNIKVDFSDTRLCERFTRHSSHYSSRNFI